MISNTITLGIPTIGQIHHENVSCIIEAVSSGHIQAVCLVPRLPVHQARSRVVQLADTTHLLFVDDDMKFTAHDIAMLKMVVDNTGARVACGLAMTRSSKESYPVVLKDAGKQWAITRKFDDQAPSKVDGATLAFALIEMLVFEEIGTEFKFENGVGEDVDFFKRCKAKGIDVWLEPRVRVGHIMDRVVYYGDADIQ